jgi:hypothetical protein
MRPGEKALESFDLTNGVRDVVEKYHSADTRTSQRNLGFFLSKFGVEEQSHSQSIRDFWIFSDIS